MDLGGEIYDKINEEGLKQFVNNCFNENHGTDCLSHNISIVHPQMYIFYNSLNVCIGKPGCGKTCFLLMELMKLSQVANHKYKTIVYISHSDGGHDATFDALKQHLGVKLLGCSFWNCEDKLDTYFKDQEAQGYDGKHTMIIIEDATFLFTKPTQRWLNWIIRLRHLRATFWLNLHQWKSLHMSIRAQITTMFIFPGYSSLEISNMFRQLTTPMTYSQFFERYKLLEGRCVVFVSCQPPINQRGLPAIVERVVCIDLNPKSSKKDLIFDPMNGRYINPYLGN